MKTGLSRVTILLVSSPIRRHCLDQSEANYLFAHVFPRFSWATELYVFALCSCSELYFLIVRIYCDY